MYRYATTVRAFANHNNVDEELPLPKTPGAWRLRETKVVETGRTINKATTYSSSESEMPIYVLLAVWEEYLSEENPKT